MGDRKIYFTKKTSPPKIQAREHLQIPTPTTIKTRGTARTHTGKAAPVRLTSTHRLDGAHSKDVEEAVAVVAAAPTEVKEEGVNVSE